MKRNPSPLHRDLNLATEKTELICCYLCTNMYNRYSFECRMELYRHFHNHHRISQAFRGYSVFAPHTNVGADKHIRINGEKEMLTGVPRPSDRTLAVTSASIESGKSVGAVNNNDTESMTTTCNQRGKFQSVDKAPMPRLQFECNNNVRTTDTTFRGDLAFPNPTMCSNSAVSNAPNIGRMRNDPNPTEAYNNHPASTNLNQVIARQRHYNPRFNPYGRAQAAHAYHLYLNNRHDIKQPMVERIVGLNFAERETMKADHPELRTIQDHQTSGRANDFLLLASSQKPHHCDIGIVNNPTPSI